MNGAITNGNYNYM